MRPANPAAATSPAAAARRLLCGFLLCAAAVWAPWSEARERQRHPPVSPTRLARPAPGAETAASAAPNETVADRAAQATGEPAPPQEEKPATSQPSPEAGPHPVATSPPAADPAPPKATPAPTVEEEGTFSEVRALLAAHKETVLASRIMGTISSIAVTHGSSFAKDKVLVSFDRGEQTARLAMAEAELAAARETHQAKLRMQGLQQASEVEVALAASAVSKAQAQINLYRAQIEQCAIKAPFTGRVVKLEAKPFQTVQPGQPLLEIVAAGPLVVRLNAPAAWLQWVKPGTSFWFRIDETGKRHQAEVTSLNGRVDAVSQTVEIEGRLLAETPTLLPGMSGTALFSQPAR